MLKKMGVTLIAVGLILCFKPNFAFEQVMYYLQYMVDRYWAFILVIMGISVYQYALQREMRLHNRKVHRKQKA